MPCTLTISSIVGYNNLCTGNFDRIEVTGTVTQCNSLTALIDCVPATGSPVSVPVVISGGTYSATFTAADLANLPCGCGDDISVEIKCDDPGSTCSTKLSQTLTCIDDDCDCITFFEIIGNCNPDGTRTVNFYASHTNAGYSPSNTIIDFGDGNQSAPFVFAPNTPLTFTHNYQAGTFTASLIRPGCPPQEIQLTIDPCTPCQVLQISHFVLPNCTAQGMRTVILRAWLTTTPWPTISGVWDFGDSTTQSIVLNSINNWDEPTPHDYAPGTTYTATLTLQNCPPVSMTFDIPECPSCCPDIQGVDIQVLGCNADCEREVRITTNFESPSGGCASAVMEWRYFDNNGTLITTGSAFTTGGSSPAVETHFFPPNLSPVQAVLNILSPNGCPDIVRSITIPPCTSTPGCPQWGNPAIEHTVLDCVLRGNSCCRKVEFRVKGDFDMGCDQNSPPPRIRIEYGDGNYDEMDIQVSGPQTVTFVNEYCQGGNYQVQVSMVNPTGCPNPPVYNVSVPACNDEDCESTPDPPEPPSPFCPCCIWLLLLNLSYFILWAFGLYQGSITVLGVTIEAAGYGIASALYGLLIFLIINFCYRRNPDCNPCWECRVYKCMFYSLLITIAVILILFILSLIFPVIQVPFWLWAALTALGAALIFFGLFRSQRCRRFFETGDCS